MFTNKCHTYTYQLNIVLCASSYNYETSHPLLGPFISFTRKVLIFCNSSIDGTLQTRDFVGEAIYKGMK